MTDRLCECGCAKPAPIAKITDRRKGHVKGQPVRFVNGHGRWPSIEQRFWQNVEMTLGCWLWRGYRNDGGYGRLGLGSGGQSIRAHRFAYELLVGPIPAGMDLDHLCRVRHCVNPAHLEPVTRQQNLARGRTWWGRPPQPVSVFT